MAIRLSRSRGEPPQVRVIGVNSTKRRSRLVTTARSERPTRSTETYRLSVVLWWRLCRSRVPGVRFRVGRPTLLGTPDQHIPEHCGLLPGQRVTLGSVQDTDLESEVQGTLPAYRSPRNLAPADVITVHTGRLRQLASPWRREATNDSYRPWFDRVRSRQNPNCAPRFSSSASRSGGNGSSKPSRRQHPDYNDPPAHEAPRSCRPAGPPTAAPGRGRSLSYRLRRHHRRSCLDVQVPQLGTLPTGRRAGAGTRDVRFYFTRRSQPPTGAVHEHRVVGLPLPRAPGDRRG